MNIKRIKIIIKNVIFSIVFCNVLHANAEPKIDLVISGVSEAQQKQDKAWLLASLKPIITHMQNNNVEKSAFELAKKNTKHTYVGRIEKNNDGSYLVVLEQK